MPPKKVDPSKAATGDEGTPAKETQVGINIEDLNLPKSIVTRLAKGVLPPNTQIQGNAMLAMTKSATVFVNYLATQYVHSPSIHANLPSPLSFTEVIQYTNRVPSSANAYAQANNRRTLSAVDVFSALEELEFPDWKERLQAELDKYTEIQNDKKNKYINKKMDNKASQGEGADNDNDSQGEEEGESQLERGWTACD
ncbi:hypothetical protein G7Y89_g8050 [Cudoniella acicularis]|uniref:DNA polymerase epsilon subunit D n=1 Tax=Cudoniella acicularis TaxID=354080 RepID=A0A8H4RHD0_9HELO|nr:hypothetical protein G7Y89_g8050 [Cudoniella acicularis]